MPVTPIFKFDDDQVMEALQATRCNFTRAAAFLAKKWGRSCRREYVARVSKQRRRLAEYVRDHREIAADQAEANIFQAVENGDRQASLQVLRTLGKDRGWVSRTEEAAKPSAASTLDAIASGRARANHRTVAASAGSIERQSENAEE